MISDAELLDWMKADAADTATLRALEQAAIKAIQQQTGRYWGATATQTEIVRFRGIVPGSWWPLVLKSDPIGGVITSLEQWDGSAWALVDATNYYVDGSLIWPNASYTWPASYLMYPYVQVRFRVIYSAGYTAAGDVWPAPEDIQQAVKLLVGAWYENRESVVVGTTAAEVPMSVQMLLAAQTRVSV